MARKGLERSFAPGWSDLAADAMADYIDNEVAAGVAGNQVQLIAHVLRSTRRVESAARTASAGLCAHDAKVLSDVLASYGGKCAGATEEELCRRSGAFLRALRKRTVRRAARALVVAPAEESAGSVAEWMAGSVEGERLRCIQRSRRLLDGIAGWDLDWLDEPGVVCYERAAARIIDERGGRADRRFIRKLVCTQPSFRPRWRVRRITMSCCSRGQPPRFATVEAVARA